MKTTAGTSTARHRARLVGALVVRPEGGADALRDPVDHRLGEDALARDPPLDRSRVVRRGVAPLDQLLGQPGEEARGRVVERGGQRVGSWSPGCARTRRRVQCAAARPSKNARSTGSVSAVALLVRREVRMRHDDPRHRLRDGSPRAGRSRWRRHPRRTSGIARSRARRSSARASCRTRRCSVMGPSAYGGENAKPGRLGTTTWKSGSRSAKSSCSENRCGQPCITSRAGASARSARACTKWMLGVADLRR